MEKKQAPGTDPAGNWPIFSCKVIFQLCPSPSSGNWVTARTAILAPWKGGVWGSLGSRSWHGQAWHELPPLQAPNEVEHRQPSFFNSYWIRPGTRSKMNYESSLSEKIEQLKHSAELKLQKCGLIRASYCIYEQWLPVEWRKTQRYPYSQQWLALKT